MPKAVEECVNKLKGKKGVRDAWALCTFNYNKKHGKKPKEKK